MEYNFSHYKLEEDVKIGDADNDGMNEIVAYYRGGTTIFHKIGGSWISEEVTILIPYQWGDRMVIGDADGDNYNEIVEGDPAGGGNGYGLWAFKNVGGGFGGWTGIIINDSRHNVDGLDIGNFDGDSQPDIVVGLWSAPWLRIYEKDLINNNWDSISLNENIGGGWDVDFVDYNNDGLDEILIATGNKLRSLQYGSSSTQIISNLDAAIDSAMMIKLDLGNECGDGKFHIGIEECEDGNAINGDGCSSSCLIEGNCISQNQLNIEIQNYYMGQMNLNQISNLIMDHMSC